MEQEKTNDVLSPKEVTFRIFFVVSVTYSLFSTIYNITHYYATSCGQEIRQDIIITSVSFLVTLLSYTFQHYKPEREYDPEQQTNYSENTTFFFIVVLTIIFGLFTIVSCFWGELNFINFCYYYQVSNCIGVCDLLICITIYGLFNIFVLYGAYLGLLNIYKIMFVDMFDSQIFVGSNNEINEEQTHLVGENNWDLRERRQRNDFERLSTAW